MKKIEQEIKVNKAHGLHARPATIFVQLANKFNSSVKVEKDGEAVDGKSIIAILSLGVNNGVGIKLVVEGEDAQEAMDDLKKFLETDDD
ncbi:MAG: HPr family phosphocarrier protein [Candidatus Omnitrophica bacterium]|nr:HPr family phosphocarrier protein [Candidatus Omnitrophota bacterium]MDD5429206.1 HPr family phosphocarrier protein [Candidatus Omnitrophota bacterium]